MQVAFENDLVRPTLPVDGQRRVEVPERFNEDVFVAPRWIQTQVNRERGARVVKVNRLKTMQVIIAFESEFAIGGPLQRHLICDTRTIEDDVRSVHIIGRDRLHAFIGNDVCVTGDAARVWTGSGVEHPGEGAAVEYN